LLGTGHNAIAVTPDGTMAYVVNSATGNVTPINLASNTAGTAVTVGLLPYGIAITPDGATAYVSNQGSNTVTPIDIAANTAAAPITVVRRAKCDRRHPQRQDAVRRQRWNEQRHPYRRCERHRRDAYRRGGPTRRTSP